MKKLGFVLMLIALTLVSSMAVAKKAPLPTTIITNDDNYYGNTATVFSFNATTGVATQTNVLTTGGYGLGGGFFAAHDVDVATTKACVWVIDTGSNDIAAFKGPSGSYAFVGNYTASNSLWAYDGGALALSADGKALYTANSESENISQWTVNSDCSLTWVADYVPAETYDLYGTGLVVSPNGKYLLTSSSDYGFVETFTINSDDSLTDLGSAYFNGFSQCSEGCYPAGIAISTDGKAIVVGNASVGQSIMFAANIDTNGNITNETVVSLTTKKNPLDNPEVPILAASNAKTGLAKGVMSMSGFGSSYPGGITTFTLNETTVGSSKVGKSTVNNASPDGYYGTIRYMGTWVVQAGYPGTISAFKGTKRVDSADAQGVGLLSLEVF